MRHSDADMTVQVEDRTGGCTVSLHLGLDGTAMLRPGAKAWRTRPFASCGTDSAGCAVAYGGAGPCRSGCKAGLSQPLRMTFCLMMTLNCR